MLKELPTHTVHTRVFRLASYQSSVRFLQEQGFNSLQVGEMMMLLRSRGFEDSLNELSDEPFRRKSRLRKKGHKSRFSDGSFSVFYSSLEAETAEDERKHWFVQFSGQPTGERTWYHMRFACDFSGTAKDLRPKKDDWPALTHHSNYEFCNKLGLEAIETGLKGLLAPSVRRAGGTNLPVFARDAIKNPVAGVFVAMTHDPSTGKVSLSRG